MTRQQAALTNDPPTTELPIYLKQIVMDYYTLKQRFTYAQDNNTALTTRLNRQNTN